MVAKCNMNPDLPEVRGIDVDPQTRCAHFHKPVDIIAIKMKCCGVFYACKDCHVALADHEIEVWPRSEWDREAVLCGACGSRMTIGGYLKSGYHCPACQAEFNPACLNHHHYYFEREL